MPPSFAAIVLSGGRNSRMGGWDKAFLLLGQHFFLDHIQSVLSRHFKEKLLATKYPENYKKENGFLVVEDMIEAPSPLAGIHSGLCHMNADFAFVVGNDMPFIQNRVIAILLSLVSDNIDVIVPFSGTYYQPLCALYHKRCLPVMEEHLRRGSYKVDKVFSDLRVRKIPYELFQKVDPCLVSFLNINTWEDYRIASNMDLGAAAARSAEMNHYCLLAK